MFHLIISAVTLNMFIAGIVKLVKYEGDGHDGTE